ncbi:MAG: hypothetical protein M1837_002005 [Sclerophora amabilis]|nr:MAG: hypothetical protein M1837_002005 [Sclerophora amabilis]
MAPSYDAAARVLQQSNGHRPVPIVPAVPLPYTQKRKPRTKATTTTTNEAGAGGGGGDSGKAETVNGSITEQSPQPPLQQQEQRSTSVDVNGTKATEELTGTSSSVEDSAHAVRQFSDESVGSRDTEPVKEQDLTPPEPQEEERSADIQTRQGYQLPPPFYPSQQQQQQQQQPQPSAPSSATSSNLSRNAPQYGHPRGHHPHLSNGSMVFGGYPDSSNPSPGPPPNGSTVPQYPPQMPAYINPGYPVSFYPSAHSHHGSEPHIPFMPPPTHGTYVQRPDLYIPVRADNEYSHQHGRRLSFAPPEGYSPFSPTGTPVGEGQPLPLNGSSGHAALQNAIQSHQPAQEDRPVINGGQSDPAGPPSHNNLSNGYVDGTGPGRVRRPADHLLNPSADDVAAAEDLQGYLLSRFKDKSTADCDVELRHENGRFEKVSFPTHSLLIARSGTLRALIESTPPNTFPKTLSIATSDRFLNIDAFEKAMQHLYGGPLLNLEDVNRSARLIQGPGMQTQSRSNEEVMVDFALAYAAAGHLLEIPGITYRGTQIASRLTNWTNLERSLSFAMEGGLGADWVLAGPTGDYTNESPERADPSASIVVERQVPVGPKYGRYAEDLLRSDVDLIIRHFPHGFILDKSASQSALLHPRLPTIKGTSSSRHNPRLSLIQFGDHPSPEEASLPVLSHKILSKILLSIPFSLLKYILESPRLGSASGSFPDGLRQEISCTVVGERERRRHDILRSRTVSNEERKARSVEWEAVGWEESVSSTDTTQQPSSIILERNWKGYLNVAEPKSKA